MAAVARRRRLLWPLCVLLGVLVAVVASHPWWLAPLVGKSLSASAGREVHFDAIRIGIDASLQPVVRMRGVRVANAPWADTQAPMVVAAEADATWSWRSLGDERTVISRLVLRDAAVDLERRADGVRNWRLRDPDSRGPGRYKILALEAHDSTLRFANAGIGLDMTTRASANASTEPKASASADAPVALPTRIDFAGELKGVPFAGSVATADTLSFMETGQRFPIRGHAESGASRLELTGELADLFRVSWLDADAVLSGRSLQPLGAFFRPRWQDERPYRFAGHVRNEGGAWALTALQGRFGTTDIAGEARYTLEPSRTLVRAELRSDAADAGDWRWLVGEKRVDVAVPPHGSAANSPPRSMAATSPPQGMAASSPLRGESLAAQKGSGRPPLDVEVSYATKKLRVAGYAAVQSASLRATLTPEQIAVPAFDLGLAGGHATGRLTIDRRADPHDAEARVAWRGVRVESLLPPQPEGRRVTGALHGEAVLRGRGETLSALADGVSGTVTASLSGGTMGSLLDAQLGLQMGKVVKSLVAGSEAVPLRCAMLALDAADGKARLRTLVVDSERTRTVGRGSVDLRARTLDAVLTAEAKGRALFVLDRSIRLHGPLARPERELVDRVPQTSTACR